MGELPVRAGSPIGGQNALVTVMKFTVRLNPTFSAILIILSVFFYGCFSMVNDVYRQRNPTGNVASVSSPSGLVPGTEINAAPFENR